MALKVLEDAGYNTDKETGDGSLSPSRAITAMGFGLLYCKETENRPLSPPSERIGA